MVVSLVGFTGLVGSNLAKNYEFDYLYNSKNIKDAYDTKPDLLIYAGVSGTKFIANQNPEEDYLHILGAIENIKKISPKKIVLISTIDVYDNPCNVDEDNKKSIPARFPYGKNRAYLEKWVMCNCKEYLIVRLPGIYGINLKKNFIYDCINFIPYLITSPKYDELVERESTISKFYVKRDKDFYVCKELSIQERVEIKKLLKKLNFSALNFTDSRGMFQYYNLKYLWNHIGIALKNSIKILNIAVEPVLVNEIYSYVFDEIFANEISDAPAKYNFITKYDDLFNGYNGYIFDKNKVLEDIKNFILDNGINQ